MSGAPLPLLPVAGASPGAGGAAASTSGGLGGGSAVGWQQALTGAQGAQSVPAAAPVTGSSAGGSVLAAPLVQRAAIQGGLILDEDGVDSQVEVEVDSGAPLAGAALLGIQELDILEGRPDLRGQPDGQRSDRLGLSPPADALRTSDGSSQSGSSRTRPMAGALDQAPWLALDRVDDSTPQVAGHDDRDPGRRLRSAPLRDAVRQALPERLSHVGPQVQDRAAQLLGDQLRPAVDGSQDRGVTEIVSNAEVEELPRPDAARGADRAPTHRSAATSTGTGRSANPAQPVAEIPGIDAPGGLPEAGRLPGNATVTRVHNPTPTVVMDGRFVDGQLPQQAFIADPQRVELQVDDGEHPMKVTLAREADGLAVEVRAPREIVAELRALEPEIDAAVAEEGFDLDSYEAHEEQGAGTPSDDDAPSFEDSLKSGGQPADVLTDDPATDEGTPAAPDGQGRVLNHLA